MEALVQHAAKKGGDPGRGAGAGAMPDGVGPAYLVSRCLMKP